MENQIPTTAGSERRGPAVPIEDLDPAAMQALPGSTVPS